MLGSGFSNTGKKQDDYHEPCAAYTRKETVKMRNMV